MDNNNSYLLDLFKDNPEIVKAIKNLGEYNKEYSAPKISTLAILSQNGEILDLYAFNNKFKEIYGYAKEKNCVEKLRPTVHYDIYNNSFKSEKSDNHTLNKPEDENDVFQNDSFSEQINASNDEMPGKLPIDTLNAKINAANEEFMKSTFEINANTENETLANSAAVTEANIENETSSNNTFEVIINNESEELANPELDNEADSTNQEAALIKPKKRPSFLSIVSNFLFYFVVISAVALAVASAGKNAAPRNIFGYSYFTVLTGSMQSEIPKGSFIITKKTDPNELKIKDNITFMQSENTSITHQIVGIYENYDDSGLRAFQTQGVNNAQPDRDLVVSSNIVGKVILTIPQLGTLIWFLTENLMYAMLFLGLLLLLSFSLQAFFSLRKKEKMTRCYHMDIVR